MKWIRSVRMRRCMCTLCALALFFIVSVPPAALAEAPAAAGNSTMTATNALEMQQADQAVTALTESGAYEEMSLEQRRDAAGQQLDELAQQGLIQAGSIYYDEENSLYTFSYSCGALGGILLKDLDEENGIQIPLTNDLEELEAEPYESLGSAVIYYAFDDAVSSSRYPYYTYMQSFWTDLGLSTRLDTEVTVFDLKQMSRYDLCVLSAHGAYLTYTYGVLWQRVCTSPVILLNERSTLYKDLFYAADLLCHRIIKLNGLYCLLPSFFRSAYRFGQLDGTIIFSETCEFLGVDNSLDLSVANALLDGGADAVVGYVNNVYTVYSRNLLWDTVNHLIMGQTLRQSLDHALSTYGENDLVWYTNQGGLKPHAAASYPLLLGRGEARLYELPEEVLLAAEPAA